MSLSDSPTSERMPPKSEPTALKPTVEEIEAAKKTRDRRLEEFNRVQGLMSVMSDLDEKEDAESESFFETLATLKEQCFRHYSQSRKTHKDLVKAANQQNV